MTPMMMKLSVTGSLCVLGAMLTGCFFVAGPKDDGPSTAQFREEIELVTDAKLAVQDTGSATRGRWGFDPGTDRLLVVTRITSVAKNIKKPKEGLYDKYFERVWLTIPLGAPLGHEISLEEVESVYLTGYDVNTDDAGYFRDPASLKGKVALMEIKSDTAVVKLDMQVFPAHRDNWRITEMLVVPLTKTGIHATAIERVQTYHPDKLTYPDEPEAASADDQSDFPGLDVLPEEE